MPIEAKTFSDPSRGAERLRRTGGVLSGERHYRVNTRDAALAITAIGLPREGDAWGPALPGLKVISIETDLIGGTDQSPQEGGGHTHVTVEYSERPVEVLPHEPGDSYTEVETQNTSVTVYGTLDGRVIAAGRGAQKDLGVLMAIASVVREPDEVDLGAIVAANERPLNLLAMSLPPMLGALGAINIGPGQARYMGARFAPTARGLVRVGHQMLLAPDHLVRWRDEGPDGTPLVPEHTGEIYEASDYQGLWA